MTARCMQAKDSSLVRMLLFWCSADLVPLELAQVTEAQQVSILGEDFTILVHIFLSRKLPASKRGWSGHLDSGSLEAKLICCQVGTSHYINKALGFCNVRHSPA